MAFKGDSDDPRESLAYKLKKILDRECREVLCSDPFVQDERLVPFEQVVERCDLLFIGTPHTEYRQADFRGKTVVDIWNVTKVGISVV